MIGRGRVRQIKVSELAMAQGGVMREDKILQESSYLTELLTPEDRRSVVLPNSRLKSIWDAVVAILVIYTALMLPIQLCFDDVRPPALGLHARARACVWSAVLVCS